MTTDLATKRLELLLQKIEKQTAETIKISSVFWISGNEQHRKLFQKTNGNCCFNHQIGLPTSKISPYREMEFFGYELDIIENITRYKDYVLNKARGIGATELILRWILFKAANCQISNRKFLIITGIRHELTKDYMRRVLDLCEKVPGLVRKRSENAVYINKAQIIAMPANPSAIRGYENVQAIL